VQPIQASIESATNRVVGCHILGGQPSCVPPPLEPIRPPRLIFDVSKKARRTAVKIAKIILAGTAALTIISSAALAQQEQELTGTLTKVDRINGVVAIRQTQNGTVGANTGGAAEEFKAQAGLSLDPWHAGDKVTYSATETGGVKTITKLQKQ
jgi:hypothetical protein